MALSIKVSSREFEAAESNGAVFGTLRGRHDVFVYIELGQEKEYIERANDNQNTRYRLFINCDVFVARTQAQLDADVFDVIISNKTVIIYN